MIDTLSARSKLWMPEDLADYLSVGIGWIYKRTRAHGPEMIPHIKLGKYLRFDPASSAFQDWLARHEAGGDSIHGLTLAFPVNRVRATEKTGQVQ
jgi:hypothetical protein